jgi:protein gp37
MIDISKGRYWDEGIKLVSGCTKCSPGCDNCWSLAMEHRFANTGKVIVHPDRLKRFNTSKPKVFAIWNDLFHEAVPDSFAVETIYETYKHNQNTYLFLTKRPDKMAVICNFIALQDMQDHIWHGLTVCNQREMEEKSEMFFSVPGNKFLSLEPLLSKVIIPPWVIEKKLLSCVILGGETGPGARPMHPAWVRSVRDQCASAGVPFFFKGLGKCGATGFLTIKDFALNGGRKLDGRTYDELPWRTK